MALARIELLAVGRELLIGRTLNTNAHWMGRRLALMGSMIKEITTVDDELGEISGGLRACLSRHPDFLVVMGGLGPTPDDMTLRGVALGLGRRMKVNAKALELMREHYARRGMANVEITPARKKMATLPEGTDPLPNGTGTAPGVRAESGRSVIYCLPGVPSEMRGMFRRSVEPEVEKKLGKLHRRAINLRVEGIYESAIAPLIEKELKRYPGTYIKSHPRGTREGVSRIELDIVSVKVNRAEANRVAEGVAIEMTRAIRASGGTVKSPGSPFKVGN
jgi:molybdopterin-biosynthesis enzyme MoeA-like protein